MNWSLVIQVFGILVGGAMSLYQIRHLLPASRATLKADLEILKLIDPSDPAFARVKAHIERAVDRNYPAGSQAEGATRIDWPLLVFFVVAATGLITWTVYLVRDGFNAWSLLTGTFALVSAFGILGAFISDEKARRKENA